MNIAFLDRDGVINRFPGHGKYVTKVKDFHILPGALDAIRRLTEAGWALFVVSNQAGVGKGIYSKDKLRRINEKMMKAVKKEGGRIKKVYYCIHRSDENCDCRKPRVGSLEKAVCSLNYKGCAPREKFFVGDTEMDMQAGKRTGCKTIFVLSGKNTRRELHHWITKPDFVAKDLWEATEIMLGDRKQRVRYRLSHPQPSKKRAR